MSLRRSAASTSRPASGPSGDDLHPELGPQVGEPVEQLGRLEPLDHHRHAVAAVDQPAPGPLPPAEVRQRQDHAVARGERRVDVLVALDAHPALDRWRRQVREPEALDAVAGVRVERLLHGAPQAHAAAAWGRRAAGGA